MKMMRQTHEIIADDELDAPYIAAEEVNEAIHRLKHRKSAGTDGILKEMLKSMHLLRPLIVKLFNQIWETGTFPKAVHHDSPNFVSLCLRTFRLRSFRLDFSRLQ